ncbi:MAG: tetratricopeptide repeat protein, partial [Bacteroidota bacterium]
MKYLTFTIIMFMLASMTSLSGQCLNKAKKQVAAYEYAEAIPVLEKIVEKNKKGSDEAVVLLANCYRMLNEDEKAAGYYAMAVEQDSADPIVYFHYGQMLRTLEKYDEAGTQFNKYATLVPDDKRGKLLAWSCKEIIAWLDHPQDDKPRNVASLNSPYADFSPVFYGQGVVFTSERPKENSQDNTFEWTGNPYLGLMFAWTNGMLSDGEPNFTQPEVYNENLVQQYHDGNVAFSPDWNIMILTRTLEERVPKDNERFRTHFLKMFQSEIEDGGWSQLEPFAFNSDSYSVGHPAFSPDGNNLYFTSDMPGGHGGTDIWVCTMNDGHWSDPQNLGPEVNTVMDEMFPYMDCKGVLYFASEGHVGFGGLDIFYTSEASGAWEKPTNMMKGINSSYDDFGVAINHKLEIGLLSSNRPGGQGSDDIYAFSMKPKPKEICGKVIDTKYKPVEGATIFFLDNESNLVRILKTDGEGKYCTEVNENTSYTILGKKVSFEDNCLIFEYSETM